tara:strand:+ start:332 stop:499 length:168 start_codon:yes stop_codon:yes gene_type:complete
MKLYKIKVQITYKKEAEAKVKKITEKISLNRYSGDGTSYNTYNGNSTITHNKDIL